MDETQFQNEVEKLSLEIADLLDASKVTLDIRMKSLEINLFSVINLLSKNELKRYTKNFPEMIKMFINIR